MPFFWPTPPSADDPPDPPPALQPDEGEDKIVRHRREHLEKAGLPYPLALELAIVGVDYQAVVRAVRAGATAEQVEAMFL